MLNSVTVDNKPVSPSKIICIGRNYVGHIQELGNEVPTDMVVFMKPNSAISNELLSFSHEPLHYEGELCLIIRNGTFHAAGFGLDLTRRKLQQTLKEKGLPWERAKSFDGAAVFSHFIKISDTNTLNLTLHINNVLTQTGNTDLMIYKPDAILRELATMMTLEDGDIVMTGTPAGVGIIHSGDRFRGTINNEDKILIACEWQAI